MPNSTRGFISVPSMFMLNPLKQMGYLTLNYSRNEKATKRHQRVTCAAIICDNSSSIDFTISLRSALSSEPDGSISSRIDAASPTSWNPSVADVPANLCAKKPIEVQTSSGGVTSPPIFARNSVSSCVRMSSSRR